MKVILMPKQLGLFLCLNNGSVPFIDSQRWKPKMLQGFSFKINKN
jgi:hypothetical protein